MFGEKNQKIKGKNVFKILSDLLLKSEKRNS